MHYCRAQQLALYKKIGVNRWVRLLLLSCGGIRQALDLFSVIIFNCLYLLYNIKITVLLQGATALPSQEDRGTMVSKILTTAKCNRRLGKKFGSSSRAPPSTQSSLPFCKQQQFCKQPTVASIIGIAVSALATNYEAVEDSQYFEFASVDNLDKLERSAVW